MYFEMAHRFTAQWEGGLTDHPADPGGITNHGVSLRWLLQLTQKAAEECKRAQRMCDGGNDHNAPFDFNGDGSVDADDIRACTKLQAAELMRRHFWTPLRCTALPMPLAVTLYDAAVNVGPAQATKILQQSCNLVAEAHLDEFMPLAVDGRCGPRTLAMARALADAGLDFYTARHTVRERRNFYIRLCRQKPNFQPFLKGWKNRCDALLEHLATLEREI